MERSRTTRVLTPAIAIVLGALVLFASPAAAGRIGPMVRKWTVSKIEQGAGKVRIDHNKQAGGELKKVFDLGLTAFNFKGNILDGRAAGVVFGTAAQSSVLAQAPLLDPFHPRSTKGGASHLEAYQAYEKGSKDASLQITLHDVGTRTLDQDGPLEPSECPVAGPCAPIRATVRYHARAFPIAGGRDFFNVGGAVYTEGHEHAWLVGAATSSDSRAPFWKDAQFHVNGDVVKNGTGSQSQVALKDPIKLKVPLRSVSGGELFMVHVTMDVEAIDDRGRESGAEASVLDGQTMGPQLSARGLTARAVPKFKEPPVAPRPAARCPAGPSSRAGTVQLSGPAFTVGEASGTPMVLVTRTGGSRGATSVIVKTSGGSAQSGTDFRPTRTLVRFENGDNSPRLVQIPIREDLATESPEDLTVSLAHPRCARLGLQRDARVTILDDDQPPPPPAPTFTIGGTVDGLQGSGLVLSNLGAELPVSANGSFTFPGTASDGQPYEIAVKTQPHNPDQVCTVGQGAGHVTGANVTDIAVHCATIAAPSGLDPTFGSGGRVSAPVGGGQGEAVVIQPGDKPVTAGWSTVGAGTDFALTRHDSLGNLDSSFGTDGIATTDIGGAGDRAHDAALLPDGGIVAVGETDAPGIQKQDFALVRYDADGTPNKSFDGDGIVTTDLSGHGDVANAVAVQSDGKIVVAGFATGTAGHSDFALARYNADGTLDTGFDGDGIVTTDFGALSDDDARALAIQPNGRIVVVGTVGEDIGVARYLPDGSLDPTFGNLGVTTTDLGFEDLANGVALTGAGGIVVAGSTIGTKLNSDFLLVRYGPDGKLDRGFGTLGIVETDFGAGADFAEDLTIDAAGRIVVVGRAGSATVLDMALARYNGDGTPDSGFATGGTLTADFHGAGDFGQDVALDSAGRIVAAGYTANGADLQFALMRATP